MLYFSEFKLRVTAIRNQPLLCLVATIQPCYALSCMHGKSQVIRSFCFIHKPVWMSNNLCVLPNLKQIGLGLANINLLTIAAQFNWKILLSMNGYSSSKMQHFYEWHVPISHSETLNINELYLLSECYSNTSSRHEPRRYKAKTWRFYITYLRNSIVLQINIFSIPEFMQRPVVWCFDGVIVQF